MYKSSAKGKGSLYKVIHREQQCPLVVYAAPCTEARVQTVRGSQFTQMHS